MKTVVIHGQSHKRSTYHIAHMLAKKIEGEFFWIMHLMQRNGFNPRDVEYWNEKGWTGKKRPWK